MVEKGKNLYISRVIIFYTYFICFRALLYASVEDMLAGFGFSGRACMLRAICEAHAYPLKGYGLLGEMLKLFLT